MSPLMHSFIPGSLNCSSKYMPALLHRPNADGGLVTLAQCRSYYKSCGDGDTVNVTTASGTVLYDKWCPCFDKKTGSNVA